MRGWVDAGQRLLPLVTAQELFLSSSGLADHQLAIPDALENNLEQAIRTPNEHLIAPFRPLSILSSTVLNMEYVNLGRFL